MKIEDVGWRGRRMRMEDGEDFWDKGNGWVGRGSEGKKGRKLAGGRRGEGEIGK